MTRRRLRAVEASPLCPGSPQLVGDTVLIGSNVLEVFLREDVPAGQRIVVQPLAGDIYLVTDTRGNPYTEQADGTWEGLITTPLRWRDDWITVTFAAPSGARSFGTLVRCGLPARGWLTVRVNGDEVGAVPVLTSSSASLAALRLGALSPFGSCQVDIDNVAVGTTGWGANDLFTADFSGGTVAPPFDSAVGNVFVVNGHMRAETTDGSSAYAEKLFSNLRLVYIRFQARFGLIMDDTDAVATFCQLATASPDGAVDLDAWWDPGAAGQWAAYGNDSGDPGDVLPLGRPLAVASWYTVDLRLELEPRAPRP